MRKDNYELGSHKRNKITIAGPGKKVGGEKAKDFKSAIKRILLYAQNQKKYIYIAMFCELLGAVLLVVAPDKLKDLTNEISLGIKLSLENAGLGINMQAVFAIGFALILIYALSYILSAVQGVILATAMQNISKNLRMDLIQKINYLPISYFSKTSKGDVLSRITNDVDTIGQSLSQSVGMIISAIILMSGSLIMMCITNIIMTITALSSTLFGFILLSFIMKNSQKYYKNQQKKLGEINGHIEEMFTGFTVVKAYNGEEKAKEVFNSINEELKNSVFKSHAMTGFMMPMMMFIGNCGYVCVCVAGAFLAIKGSISFGVIVAFIVYIRLFTQPLGQVAQSMQGLQSGAAAAERVFEFLDEPNMPDEENILVESHKNYKLSKVQGEVEFLNVQFAYDEKSIVLNNFSAIAKAGQKVAIVGATGAGKTTVVNLLMRFYEMQGGDILIDGVSIKDISRKELHAQFSMVLQDAWLFEGSVKENLIYSTTNVSEKELENAIEAVGLHHFIKTLEYGYDTVLNDKVELSEGQKQQITIARAIIANKPMLILDEATSSIDTRTELQIQSAMDTLMQNRTSFVIAHRLSTIKNADLILVMQNGNVVESGTHKKLLGKNSYYAELYNSQFEA